MSWLCGNAILKYQRRLDAKQMNSIANGSPPAPNPQYKLDYTKIFTGLCASAAAINISIDNLDYACRDSYVSSSERPTCAFIGVMREVITNGGTSIAQLPVYLNVEEVANLIRVKRRTIYEMVAQRRIPF